MDLGAAVGAAWGCTACGAAGPLIAGPCPSCRAEIPRVVLIDRRTGVHLYNEALAAAHGGFWSDGIELLEQALEIAGADAGALGLLGLLYCQSGRVAEALAVWRQVGAVNPQARWVRAVEENQKTISDYAALQAYRDALHLAKDGGWDGALEVLEPVTGPGVRLAQAFVLKGISAWVLGRYADAEAAWQRAIELDPSVPGLQPCLIALVERSQESVPAPAPAPAVPAPAPELPGALRARWGAAAAAVLLALAAGTAGYEYTRVQAAQTELKGAALRRAEESAERAQAAQAQAQAQAQAETAAKQSGARETGALRLLEAANLTGRAEEIERLIAALAEAKRTGVAVPEWVERSVPAARTRGAVDRYFEGYQAFLEEDYPRAVAGFEASLRLEQRLYCSDDAAYLAGKSAELANNPAEAVRWYERLLREYPDSDYQDDSLFFGAEMAAKAGDRVRATQWYKELLSRFPGSGYDSDAEDALARLTP